MTTESRWYVLAREHADGKSDYVFIGTAKDKEAANAKIDAEPEAREALKLRAVNRKQAADTLPQVYDGRKVKGWISPADKRAGQQIVKAAVMREIFCPYTGVILDMRRAVVIDDGRRQLVCAATHWDKIVASYPGHLPALEEANKRPVTVYDGRELFK